MFKNDQSQITKADVSNSLGKMKFIEICIAIFSKLCNTYVVFTNFTQSVFIHNENNEHAYTPISEEANLKKATYPLPEM